MFLGGPETTDVLNWKPFCPTRDLVRASALRATSILFYKRKKNCLNKTTEINETKLLLLFFSVDGERDDTQNG